MGGQGGSGAKHVFSLHHRQPNSPYVLSPIYWDRGELIWVIPKLKSAFSHADDLGELKVSIDAIKCQRDEQDGKRGFRSGLDESAKRLLAGAQMLLPNAPSERAQIESGLGVEESKALVVYNAISPNVGSLEAFVRETGFQDFALCVGRVEWNKNQALLALALRGLGLPLVFIGKTPDAEYRRLCEGLVGGNPAEFLGELDHALVQSAYCAAAVHVLVGFGETPGLANLEAAAQGCPIVVSTRGAERDYFGSYALYADPLNPASIRSAVEQSITEGRGERTTKLQRIVLETYTWDQAAEATLAAYQEALFGEAEEKH